MIKHYIPNDLEELYLFLKNMTKNSKIISGGTDLGISLNKKVIIPDALLYIGNVKESKEISLNNNEYIEIGASLTHTEIQNNKIIQKYFTCIVDACKDIGSVQIRNNGTIGGNIGNASPAADLLPVLYMLNTIVTIASSKGELIDIPIKEFILGPGKIKLNSDEAILKFKIPVIYNYESIFLKLGFRQKLTISRIGLCIGFSLKNQIVEKIDIVVGAISSKPVVLEKAERYLLNKNIINDFDDIQEVVSTILSETIMTLTPENFDRDYKIWAAKGIVFDIFTQIKNRIL